ncbi:MAG: T9SS type A sorting domain-containing protein, partial [Bacteroidales bacterium]|nr:T9SS type A sorting domain-containing protein [Bacteroidales bacterium]
YAVNCHYTETYVPDDNFEAALSSILGVANNNDNYISTIDIKACTTLDISNQNIADITGLQDFTALTLLNCNGNQIDSLDLSSNTFLSTLNCANNLIDTLNLTNNTALQSLDFSTNQVRNINIAFLSSLSGLTCNNNNLTNLDLKNNTNLTSVNCSFNQLNTLILNNGNNAILTTFNATNNPALFCIEVDDSDGANAGTGVYASWLKDASASYGNNCHYGETYVPDDAFEQALKDLGYDNSQTAPLDDYVPTTKINKITYLSLNNKGISDLTGIEDFSALVTFNCSNNNLSSVDFSNNLALVTFNGAGNQLTNLNISLNTALKKLDVTSNLFSSIDISNNILLERLLCSSNLLTSLNILNNTSLIEVNCSQNQLRTVDANNGSNSTLQYFDLRNNPLLSCILVDDVNASLGYTGWNKDIHSAYKLFCDDDDNDGVIDAEDLCPDTPFGELVDVFGCTIFILPADNFTVITKSETCRGGNDGRVLITADSILNYAATLTGVIDTVVFRFTNDVEIRNVRAGTYALDITVEDKPDYVQSYQVIITQPEALNVTLKMNEVGNKATFKMSGGENYTIEFNGLVFHTTESELSLHLEKGKNTISIKADFDCQGVYSETLFNSDESIVFPNPFNENLNIYLGPDCGNKVALRLYSFSGQLVLVNQYQPQNEMIQVNTSAILPGVYYLLIKSETQESITKIVKE